MYGIPHTPVAHAHQPITDQITDQKTPYCDELGYAVCDENRVLAVIRCIRKEPSPPRCAIILTTHDETH